MRRLEVVQRPDEDIPSCSLSQWGEGQGEGKR